MADFQPAVDFAIQNETSGRADGALTRDPLDAGGTTKWGIAQRSHPGVNIAELSRADACAIYFEQYWTPESGLRSLVSQRIASKIFDACVNLGLRGGALAAQRTVDEMGGDVAQDGNFGIFSAQAVNSQDEQQFLLMFAKKLADGYEILVARNPADGRFLKGWLNRARRMP